MRPEQRHQSVAHALIQRAAVIENSFSHFAEVVIENTDNFLRPQRADIRVKP